MATLRAEGEARDGQVDDSRLADYLVMEGVINRWQANELLAGERKFTLGQYQIVDEIGRGGMGRVLKGVHSLMGRIAAIKVLPRDKSTPDAVASFEHEIRLQSQLDHENLVRAFDAGYERNMHFLVTEFVDGTDLRRLVRSNGPLSMHQAAMIISQAAKGLEHAHDRGLIHRDVKPGNLLVTHDGHTKVSDLGLAGSLRNTTEDPKAGRVVGTADYLSPEQILSPSEITPASDIYSLGCTLYYAVTGKVPYPGGTSREKARRHCEDAPPLYPRLLNPALSDEFIEVIADMMAKNPRDRIQNGEEVVRRLAPWAGDTLKVPPVVAKATAAQFSFTPKPGPIAPGLGDTLPDFPDSDSQGLQKQDSPSQLSQGTEPVDTAAQETLPIEVRQPELVSLTGWSPSSKWLAAAGALIAALTAAALALVTSQ